MNFILNEVNTMKNNNPLKVVSEQIVLTSQVDIFRRQTMLTSYYTVDCWTPSARYN